MGEKFLRFNIDIGTCTDWVTRLGGEDVEKKLIGNAKMASDLFVPQIAMTRNLADVLPVFLGIFVFRGHEDNSFLQLDIEFKRTVDAFEMASTRWSRLDQESGSATQIVDLVEVDVSK